MLVRNEQTVLKIVVGDEHPLAVRVERQQGLQRQNGITDDEGDDVEHQQREAVRLPVLRTRIEKTFDASSRGSVEDPSHVSTQGYREGDGQSDYQQRQQPHCLHLSTCQASCEPFRTQQRGQEVGEQQNGEKDGEPDHDTSPSYLVTGHDERGHQAKGKQTEADR